MYESYFSLLVIAWKQAAFAYGEGFFSKKWTFRYEKPIIIMVCLFLSYVSSCRLLAEKKQVDNF